MARMAGVSIEAEIGHVGGDDNYDQSVEQFLTSRLFLRLLGSGQPGRDPPSFLGISNNNHHVWRPDQESCDRLNADEKAQADLSRPKVMHGHGHGPRVNPIPDVNAYEEYKQGDQDPPHYPQGRETAKRHDPR